jgi:O-antigen/teichoic acid export membrane protein
MDLRRHFTQIVASGCRFAGHFRSDFSWAVSSNVAYYGSQWGIVIILARLGTPSDLGAYALGLAVTSPILMFTSFQARNLVASDVSDEFRFSDYVTFRILSLGAALLIMSGIIAATVHNPTVAFVALLVGVAQGCDCVSDTYFGLLQKNGRLDRVSISLMLKGPLCIVLLGITMQVSQKIIPTMAALVVGRGLVLICVDIPNGFAIGGAHGFAWNWKVQRRLFLTALPLGVIACLGGLNLNIPRYFIESDLSRHDLGIFSAIASLIGAGNLIMASLASCVLVPLAKAWEAHDTVRYRSLYRQFVTGSCVVGIAGVLMALGEGDRILRLLFRPDYAGNAGVFARVMIVGAVGYVVSAQGYTMTAARKLLQQIPALAGSAIVTAICSWFLVPRRGLVGAADCWLMGSLFLFVYNAVLLSRLSASAPPAPQWRKTALTTTFEGD